MAIFIKYEMKMNKSGIIFNYIMVCFQHFIVDNVIYHNNSFKLVLLNRLLYNFINSPSKVPQFTLMTFMARTNFLDIFVKMSFCLLVQYKTVNFLTNFAPRIEIFDVFEQPIEGTFKETIKFNS